MEIQTFFLAEHIHSRGNRHDVDNAGITIFEYTSKLTFPVRFGLPGLLMLRRHSCVGDTPISLHFNLVDEDGQPAGQPRRLDVAGVFPDGYWVYRIVVTLHFEFPRPGHYRLDITADDELDGGVYHYGIDIMPKKL